MALAALKGEVTLAELAERFGVHPNQIIRWRSQLVAGAAEVFSSGSLLTQEGSNLKALHAKAGRQTLEIDFLSATLGKLVG